MLSLLLDITMQLLLKVLNAEELHILKSFKVNCSNISCFYPCDLFLINNINMTVTGIETHYFIVLNVKLQVKIRFIMPY